MSSSVSSFKFQVSGLKGLPETWNLKPETLSLGGRVQSERGPPDALRRDTAPPGGRPGRPRGLGGHGPGSRAARLGAGDVPARHHHGDPGHRRLDDRPLRHRAADPDLARRHSRRGPQRDRRDRRQELLSPQRRGSPPHGFGRRLRREAPAIRAGRLHPDAAARAPDLPLAAQDDLAEDQRVLRDLRDRATLLEGPDPDDVRERDLPRARQLRVRGRLPLLLRKEPEEREPRRGRAAGGHRPAPGGPVPLPQSRARPEPALDGAAPDARRGVHHRGPAGGRGRGAPPLRAFAEGDGRRSLFLRGDPAVPGEDVRGEGPLPPRPACGVDARPGAPGLFRGGAGLGAPAARAAARVPPPPQPPRRGIFGPDELRRPVVGERALHRGGHRRAAS